MRDTTVTVALPGGSWIAGRRARSAQVRAPTGVEEAVLAADAPPVERVTALLAALVVALEGVDVVDAGVVRSLTVGDREALALAVRRATFGERLDCVLTCPACGEPVDLPLTVAELLHEPYARSAECHETLQGEQFRLPTGADQEAVAATALADPETAARALFDRCVESGTALDAAARERIGESMADLDPQADLRLAFACPECEAPIEAPLDAGCYLLDEIASASADLVREVHVLASHYHWSERDILALPLPRRRRYLELIAGEEMEP